MLLQLCIFGNSKLQKRELDQRLFFAYFLNYVKLNYKIKFDPYLNKNGSVLHRSSQICCGVPTFRAQNQIFAFSAKGFQVNFLPKDQLNLTKRSLLFLKKEIRICKNIFSMCPSLLFLHHLVSKEIVPIFCWPVIISIF